MVFANIHKKNIQKQTTYIIVYHVVKKFVFGSKKVCFRVKNGSKKVCFRPSKTSNHGTYRGRTIERFYNKEQLKKFLTDFIVESLFS